MKLPSVLTASRYFSQKAQEWSMGSGDGHFKMLVDEDDIVKTEATVKAQKVKLRRNNKKLFEKQQAVDQRGLL